MEQETKHKMKKAMAIAGIATLSAFALIGLFAIGSLIGGCAEKKQPDAAASEQVKTAHTLRRAGADVAADDIDILADADWLHVGFGSISGGYFDVVYQEDYKIAWVNLPRGYYRLTYDYDTYLYGVVYTGTEFFRSVCYQVDQTHATHQVAEEYYPSDVFNVYHDAGTQDVSYHVFDAGLYGFFTWTNVRLELVDFLDVPASSVVSLPEDWNPTAWVSDEAIGGYPVVHGSYTTEANASGAYVRVGWSNLVFKTASDSAVFTSLVVRYRWLWNGQKYRINDQTLTYAYSSENALLYPVSVSYLDPLTNTWTIVAKEAQDVIGGDYVHTGKLNWLYPTYRTLGFLDYPQNPTSPTIRFYHSGEAGSGEATWQPTPTLQGLTFFDWFGLASWNSPQQVDVGTGNAIGLISTAFSGMVPILGISIFPNITLGLLLFLPLIGGIIVLIIKAVSK